MNIIPLKLTLDTNCVINLLDGTTTTATSVEVLNELMRLGLSNKLEIKITTRVEADLSRDENQQRKQEMLRILNMFPVVGTIARLDVTRLDGGDVVGGNETNQLEAEVQRILFPGLSKADKRYSNKQNDIDHLVGHSINKRDIFVTDDSGILGKAEELRSSPGIVVMRPDRALSHVQASIERQTTSSLETEDMDPKYQSKALRGTVTFDYSNNNHRFVIGEGQFLFETRWSKANATSIYAYNDPPSIKRLALLKKQVELKEIGDAGGLDYSSRTRCPDIGQIVIWENVNGIYAATKIIAIKDDSRGSDHDELTFEYLIQIDGTAVFK